MADSKPVVLQIRKFTIFACILAGMAGACSRPGREVSSAYNWLFDGTPGELLNLAEANSRQVTPVATFKTVEAMAPDWRVEGGTATEKGRCLAPGGGKMEVHGPATAAMVASERIEIEIKGIMLMPVVLAWGKPFEEAPSSARRSWADAQGATRSRISYEVGEVASAPRVGDNVGIRLLAESDREICLEVIEAVTDRRDDARLASLAEAPHRLDLDGEVRSARLALPGAAIEVAVPSQTASAIRVGFGRVGKADSPFVYSVSLLAGSERRELLSERWAVEDADGWRDREIPVSDLPRGARLRLEAAAEGDPGLAVPVWSHVIGVPRPAVRKRTNVVLISIDTLRADRLSIYGAERVTSPGIDAWAKRRGILFENAIAQAPWTLPSHASMLSGLEPFRHSAVYANPVPGEVVLLQQRLARVGYRTRAVTGAAYLDPRYGFSRGFERYRHWTGSGNRNEILHGLDWAFRYLDEIKDEPFFLFFHTYEVHGPYRAHQPYFSRFSKLRDDMYVIGKPSGPEDPGRRERQYTMMMFPPGKRELQVPLPEELARLPLDSYDSGVASADDQISRLISRLEELGIADQTMVIVTADHGEALGEHEVGGHGFLYDDNLHVPLILALPGGRSGGRRIPDQVRSIDIVPTVLEVAGLEPVPGLDGQSLMPLVEGRKNEGGREAWSYSGALGVSLRLGNRAKFLFWDGVGPSRAGKDRFFDLERDSGELVDRVSGLGARAKLEERVLSRLRTRSEGLKIRLSAPRGSAEQVRVAAPWLGADITKWSANPIDEVDWPTSHSLEVPLAAGAASEILVRLLKLPTESLDITFTDSAGVAHGVAQFPYETGPRRSILGYRSGNEIRFAATLPPGVGPRPLVEIEWSGAVREDAADPAQEDASLREQLKALGYLN